MAAHAVSTLPFRLTIEPQDLAECPVDILIDIGDLAAITYAYDDGTFAWDIPGELADRLTLVTARLNHHSIFFSLATIQDGGPHS